MRKFDKILLFAISLMSLIVSVCILALFYPVPFVQDAILELRLYFPWVNYIFIIYSGILCLAFFILLIVILFLPGTSDFLVITKNKGKLLFSRKTVESTVRYSFADLEGINHSYIKVKINKIPDKTKVYLKLSLSAATDLASLTETVQEKISSTLQSSLNITVKSITIRVIETNPGHSVEKESDGVRGDYREI